MLQKNLIDSHWDYSVHAKYYQYRPNYSSKAIGILLNYINFQRKSSYDVADIGAGTGNLSILLSEQGYNFKIFAIEPNDAMRNIGIERTNGLKNIKWIKASGTEAHLEGVSVDWVTFGSSFNVLDRDLALKEAYRILKDEGFFTCMWNHRNLSDPIQKTAEGIIMEFIPDYNRGVRREDQRGLIERNRHLFNNIFYIEVDFEIVRTIDEYINAWKSVKNKYWNIEKTEGRNLFEKITDKMRENLPQRFKIMYTTRAWTAQKVKVPQC